MKKVSIRDIAGTPIWVSPKDGQRVFSEVSDALLAEEKVELSFAGREHVITAFLNVVIGQLYAGSIPLATLESNLSYVDLDHGDKEKVDMVVENAKRFFHSRKK